MGIRVLQFCKLQVHNVKETMDVKHGIANCYASLIAGALPAIVRAVEMDRSLECMQLQYPCLATEATRKEV